MKTQLLFNCRNWSVLTATALLLIAATTERVSGQSLTNDLVSHWPLDVVQGTKTPDVVSGYDMNLNNLTAADLVVGYASNCFSFANARQTLLSRVHEAGDNLPINKHPALTILLWINATGTGQFDLRFFSEGNTTNSNPLFNLGTHNLATDNNVDIFFRQAGWTDVNHIRTTLPGLDGTWHHFAFVQQADGSRTIYIDGVADPLLIPAKEAGTWSVNDTTIGGILRASASHWITGLIDEVAVWKRALNEAEINDVMANGVPRIGGPALPLEIKSFTADFGTVVQGDRVALRWDASKDATLSISPGIGDVTGSSLFGVGSIETVVNQNTTYTLTATRGAESLTGQVSVVVLTGVAPNWRLVENFELPPQGSWLNPEGVFTRLNTGTNHVLGYSGGNDLAAIRLTSLTVRESQSATLFFRVNVADPASPIGTTVGLTERPIRFNDDFDANIGPYVRFDRGTANVTVSARNGVGQPYNPMPDTIEPGKVYNVWIDAENRSFDVVGGVQNGGDHYSVHIAEEGAVGRTTLFADYVADRDAINIDPALGAPLTNLIYVFLCSYVDVQGVNQVLFDDIFLSSGGFNSTVPVPAKSFRIPIRMTNAMVDTASNFSLTWNAIAGKTYTINVKLSLAGQWVPVETGYPAGGATGATVTYLDLGAVAFNQQAFYQIVEE